MSRGLIDKKSEQRFSFKEFFCGIIGGEVITLKVTQQDLDTVAGLSRLRIADEDRPEVLAQLDKFLTYVDNLQQVDTSNVEPTTYALPMKNVFRADVVKPSLDRELALSNAPLKEDGYFKVPRVLEE